MIEEIVAEQRQMEEKSTFRNFDNYARALDEDVKVLENLTLETPMWHPEEAVLGGSYRRNEKLHRYLQIPLLWENGPGRRWDDPVPGRWLPALRPGEG